MEQKHQKVWVNDIEAMVADYQANLFAVLLDQTDTTALLAIEDDFLEFIIIDTPKNNTVCIQFTTEAAFRNVSTHLSKDIVIQQHDNQNSFQSGYIDVEDNVVSLHYHQVFIPVSLNLALL